MFSTAFTSFMALLFSLSITLFVFMHGFWPFSSDVNSVNSLNPTTNVFVFGDLLYMVELFMMELIRQVNELCYNFSISNDLTQIVNLTGSLHWEILVMVLSQFPLTLCQIQNGMSHFIGSLMTILVLSGMVYVVIWEMFHQRISLNSVLLLLLVTLWVGFGWSWCIYPSSNIRSSLTRLFGF